MFAEHFGVVAINHSFQVLEVDTVERAIRSNGQTDAVNRKRIRASYFFQVVMGGTAGTHVILGMGFEPADVRILVKNFPVVIGLEGDTRSFR